MTQKVISSFPVFSRFFKSQSKVVKHSSFRTSPITYPIRNLIRIPNHNPINRSFSSLTNTSSSGTLNRSILFHHRDLITSCTAIPIRWLRITNGSALHFKELGAYKGHHIVRDSMIDVTKDKKEIWFKYDLEFNVHCLPEPESGNQQENSDTTSDENYDFACKEIQGVSESCMRGILAEYLEYFYSELQQPDIKHRMNRSINERLRIKTNFQHFGKQGSKKYTVGFIECTVKNMVVTRTYERWHDIMMGVLVTAICIEAAFVLCVALADIPTLKNIN